MQRDEMSSVIVMSAVSYVVGEWRDTPLTAHGARAQIKYRTF